MKLTALLVLMLMSLCTLSHAEETSPKSEVRSLNQLTPAERAKYDQLIQTMHEAKQPQNSQQKPASTQSTRH